MTGYRQQKDWHVEEIAEQLTEKIENHESTTCVDVTTERDIAHKGKVPDPSKGTDYVLLDPQQGYSDGYIRVTMTANNTSAFTIIDLAHELEWVVGDVWTTSYDENVIRFKIVPRELSELD